MTTNQLRHYLFFAFAVFVTSILSTSNVLADANADWLVRSTAPGVYAAVGFDQPSDVSNWTHPDSKADHVSWEQQLKASGNGSLRFDIYKEDNANSGNWVHWLSDDQREFTTGDEFYVQYRQYVPAYRATHKFSSGGGWKQSIISRRSNVMNGVNQPQPYGSNQLNEIVLQNTEHRGMIQGYNRDSNGSYPPWQVSAVTACSQTDFRYQNAVDRGPNPLSGLSPDNNPWTNCEQDRARYGGLLSYIQQKPDGYVAGTPDPLSGAVIYHPDEWLTMYLWVKLGIYGGDSHDTHVKVWAARESDEDYTLIMDRDNIDLGNGPNHDAIWFLPFNTGQQPDLSREDTFTLYDELIVSANPIPAPTTGLSFSLYADPTTFESGSNTTLTWVGDAANSCVASGDWSGNKAGSGSKVIESVTQDSTYFLQCTGAEGDSTRVANVSVTPVDNIAPSIDRVTASGDPNVIKITFSEPVEKTTAETISNYAIDSGVTITAAIRATDSENVVSLITSTLVTNTGYTLTVNNITDISNANNPITSNSQTNFIYVPSLQGSNTDPAGYQWGTLDIGEIAYIDRSYTYQNVPAQYVGLDYLQTANADKNNTSNADFLTFDLPQEAIVYIGHDRRITNKPTWLSAWSDNGDDILTTDAIFDVYEQEMPAGQVSLGGNLGNGASMYMVFTGPSAPGSDAQPNANDDSASTVEDQAVLVDVLANDFGLIDAPISINVINAASNGSTMVSGNQVLYTPNNGFSGNDSFSYRITDNDGDSNDALVVITVVAAGGNSLPNALNDSVTTMMDSVVDINVLGNDSGLNDAPLTVSIINPPANGAATVAGNNHISYAPKAGFSGADNFTYRVTDADGDQAQATVSISVTAAPGDSSPVLENDAVVTTTDTVIIISVLANDGGLDDEPITLSVDSNPINGSAVVSGGDSITYTPASGFAGIDSLTYRVTDADGDSAVASVTITVDPPGTNQTPLAQNDVVSTNEDTAITISVLSNDSGISETPLSMIVVTPPVNGVTTINTDQSITYIPNGGYLGTDNFVYRVTDVDGDASQASVSVEVQMLTSPSEEPSDEDASGGGATYLITILMFFFYCLRRITLTRTDSMKKMNSQYALLAASAFFMPLFLSTTSAASELSEAAIAMAPGTFVELETEGLTYSYMTQGGCSSSITSFTDNAVWDPISRQFLFIGGPHGCPHAFASYSEATNTWTKLTPYSDTATHGYDHTTIDVDARKLYFRKHGKGGFHVYNLVTNTWSVDALPKPAAAYTQVSGGLEYFPEIDKLVFANYGGGGEVHIYENNAWNKIDQKSMGERATIIEYNPVHGLILFGGGYLASNSPSSREIYTIDENRTIIKKDASKVPSRGLSITKTIVTVDPVSGKYLVFSNGNSFHEYDVINDSWKPMTVSVPFLDNSFIDDEEVVYTVAAPISTYGVVMFLQQLGSGAGGPKAWLYKHQDSGPPDTTPPTTPINLMGDASSASEIQLSWSVASDPDSGVSSYNVYRDSLLIGNSLTNSYSDGGLADDSAYSYQVAALNGSSLEGAKSSAVVVTTLADNTAPSILSASAAGDPNQVIVRYSEPVSQGSAENSANYAISNGVTVSSATREQDPQSVRLTTSTLSDAVVYSLTINNVTDEAATPNVISSNSQTSFEFIPSLAGINTSPLNYLWDTLSEGANVYVDRSFVYGAIPSAYEGLDYLQTANDDKGSVGNAFLSFETPKDAKIYVAHDRRIASKPSWLNTWAENGDQLITNDTTLELYEKVFSAGQVVLGGNEGGNSSMYTVIVGPNDDGSPVDAQPVANADAVSATENTFIDVNVLANDSGLADAPLTVAVTSQPSNGSASVISNNVRYTPDADFTGQDSLTYRVTDADGDASTATVTITVSGIGSDTQPVANDDLISTPQDQVVDINVLANDSGLVDTPITLSITTNPSQGLASIINGSTIRYTPNVGYIGSDLLVYEIRDTDGDVAQATVNLVIFGDDGANSLPVAAPDIGNTEENTAVNIDVLQNDFGLNDVPLTLSVTTMPSNGSILVESDNTLTYTPVTSFSGIDSLIYEVSDADADTSQAIVTINVLSETLLDALPTLANDTASTTEGSAVTILVMNNDSGLTDAPITMAIMMPPGHGTATISGGAIIYTPDSGFVGNDSLVYRVTDQDGDIGQATVTIAVTSEITTMPDEESSTSGGGAVNFIVWLMFLLACVRRIAWVKTGSN